MPNPQDLANLENYNSGIPRKQTAREEDIVRDSEQEFAQLQLYRSTFAFQWNEVAELIWPEHRNTFYFGDYNYPGEKKTHRQIDATGMLALDRFASIGDSMITPRNMLWHGLAASDPALQKDRTVQLWFEKVTDILFQYRYAPHGNFASQNSQVFRSLGAFGTAGMFVDEFDGSSYGGVQGLRYRNIPLGELFIRENHQGLVDGFIRWFRLTAYQAYQKWGPEKFPATLKPALEARSQTLYDFIHRVIPRTDYDPDRLDERGKPFVSYYVSLHSHTLMSEGGYRTLPLIVSRYTQAPQEVYGRSPAMQVLPALKTLNAEKAVFLKTGHRVADPVLLTTDDGIVDMSFRPGAMNKGGISPEGRPLIQPLPVGNLQITKEMMDEERNLINDAFLVTLFQILVKTPTMSATEVIERINEKGILLAPTLGRQQSEYLGPLIDRELEILAFQGLLPPMPPQLREAKGEYRVVYTSPLSRAAKAQEVAGFLRTVESTRELVAITQDQSLMDTFDFDTAIPAMADIQSVPVSWMANPAQIAQKRKARAAQLKAQQQIQAAPAQAAMMKAQAVQAKAGIGQQQQGAGPQPNQGGSP